MIGGIARRAVSAWPNNASARVVSAGSAMYSLSYWLPWL
jgi:hypothetical protein